MRYYATVNKDFVMLRRAICVSLAGLALQLSNAAAQSEAAAVNAAIECLGIESADARLACLEAAATTLKETRIIREDAIAAEAEREREDFGLAKSDRMKETDAAKPVVTETEDEFGAEAIASKRKERDETRLQKIDAKIVEVRVDRFGKVTVSLDNGQVWQQLAADDKRVVFGDGKLYTARVKRSIVGNYMMRVNETGRTIRVRRIK